MVAKVEVVLVVVLEVVLVEVLVEVLVVILVVVLADLFQFPTLDDGSMGKTFAWVNSPKVIGPPTTSTSRSIPW